MRLTRRQALIGTAAGLAACKTELGFQTLPSMNCFNGVLFAPAPNPNPATDPTNDWVVYQPVTDKLYAGVVDGACFLEQGRSRRALHMSSAPRAGGFRLLVSRSNRAKKWERVEKRFEKPGK